MLGSKKRAGCHACGCVHCCAAWNPLMSKTEGVARTYPCRCGQVMCWLVSVAFSSALAEAGRRCTYYTRLLFLASCMSLMPGPGKDVCQPLADVPDPPGILASRCEQPWCISSAPSSHDAIALRAKTNMPNHGLPAVERRCRTVSPRSRAKASRHFR